MTESLPKVAVASARGVWLLGCVVSVYALSPRASAESLPASVRSCAAETDAGRRLACYDNAVARFTENAPPAETKRAATTECCAGAPVGGVHADSKLSTVPSSAKPGQADLSEAHKEIKGDSAQKESRHLTARVVSINSRQGEMVLHLDNGQVWKQVQEATADMNLQPGDTVTIDRSLLGSYWLGGRTEGIVKVRREK